MGTLTTVGRALRLIGEGALQEQSLVEVARRLGVSARHLDRLFLMHLGASPKTVAKTWRLNYARRLIRDTDLPMSRVALESGFRTVRRFNDSIRSLYGRPPSQLRRLRSVVLRESESQYVLRLPYQPPYDWESLLSFLDVRAIPGVEEVLAGAYRRTFTQGGRDGILEVRNDARAHALEVLVRCAEPAALLPVAIRVRAMFDLAADTSTIAEHFRRDTLLRRLVKRYPGLRVPGAWNGFELAVRAILGQQVSVAAASTLAGRVAQGFGKVLTLSDSGGLRFLFPTPEALAAAKLEGMPQARARAVRSAARLFADSGVVLAQTEDALLSKLARVKGIGDWTVQYIALRAFGQPDAFPASDLVLLRAAGNGYPLSVPALRARAERWRPWRSYAAVYLWRSAADEDDDLPIAAGSHSAPASAPGLATGLSLLRLRHGRLARPG
jgi:AraC family transcriptional regulator of adaptative response / DNA-3-methyladenine glycosylase II